MQPSVGRDVPIDRKRKIIAGVFFALTLHCSMAAGEGPAFNRTGYGSYGIVARKQSSSRRIIFQPLDGAFNEGFEVSYYDKSGEVICRGKIQGIYRDEIYSIAEECERFEEIKPGFGVAFNGDLKDLMEVYKNKENLEARIRDREWNRFAGTSMELAEEQFDKMVNRSSLPILVEFYVTWCPYCERFKPILEEIAKDLEGKVRIAAIDAEKAEILAKELNVKKFPAFYLIKDGKVLGSWTGAFDDKAPVIKYLRDNLHID